MRLGSMDASSLIRFISWRERAARLLWGVLFLIPMMIYTDPLEKSNFNDDENYDNNSK